MGVTAGFCALKARFIPLATRRTAESVMTKFGFIRSGKGEIFWRKAQRNETIAQLRDLERQRLQVYSFFMTCQCTPKNDWKHFMPSSFFAQCFQVWFVLIKLEHLQSFLKRLITSIFDDFRPKFVIYFLWLALYYAQPSFTGAWKT